MVLISAAQALAGIGLTLVVGLGALRSDLEVLVAAATVIMWAVVCAGLVAIWWGLYRRRAWARTPFVLTQAFALVVAWPLVASDLTVDRVAGVLLGLAAGVGLVAALRPAAREALV